MIERKNNTFDGFNRLKKVERISAGVRSISEFLYNGDNLRVSKTVKKSSDGYKEQVTKYLYDRQYVILETDGNNKVKTRYVKGINYIASLNASNNISYFLFNGHGDVVQTVDKAGEVLNHYDYDIWGNPILTLEIEESAIRYAGEFYDSETGLYYLRARYYDPYIGRFISEDSYWGEDNNPLSLNRYTYAHNDPIQYLDPTGYSAMKSGSMGSAVASSLQTMLSKQVQNIAKLVGNAVNQLQTTSNTATSVKNNTGGTASAKSSQSNEKTADIKSSGSGSITTSDIQSSASSSIKTAIAMSAIVATGISVKIANSQNAEVKESIVEVNKSSSAKASIQSGVLLPTIQSVTNLSAIISGALSPAIQMPLVDSNNASTRFALSNNSKKNQVSTKGKNYVSDQYVAGFDENMLLNLPSRMDISPEGLEVIANFELSEGTIKAWGLGEYDKKGNLTGIYPYYVFKNKGTDKKPKWVSDGGITFGYGHYVDKAEYKTVTSERALVDTYAKGASMLPTNTPKSGVPYVVPNSTAVPIEEVMKLYKEDIASSVDAVNDFLDTNNISLEQHQFDMLVSFSHQYGNNWWTRNPEKVLPEFIREGQGSYDPDDVIEVFNRHDDKKRRAVEADIFNNGYK